MDNFLKVEKVYTILELNTAVCESIRKEFFEQIWVCGEIQGLRPERSKKHTYFELVEKGSQDEGIVAKVKVVLFDGRRGLIERRIEQTKGAFELKNDIEVKFLCEVSLHVPSGQYSLIVIDIDTIYTLGKVAQNRLKIIEELKTKGLLERNKLKPLPLLPLNVGLITAYDSAAYHDFTNELTLSGYGFKILAFNCHMQGKLVESDLLSALGFFNNLSPDELDVIVITRGGGSIADLSYFDNRKIAEHIANSHFPVVSAIGHQIDTTITDLVAHTVCKTPTGAGRFLIETVKQFMESLDSSGKEIIEKSQSLLLAKRKDLRTFSLEMESAASQYFRFHREELIDKKHRISSASKVILAERKEGLKRYFDNFKSLLPKIFKNSQEQLRYAEQKTGILNPQNILKRGYSITLKNNKALKSIDDVNENDTLRTVLHKGSLISAVKKKEVNYD